MTAASRRCGSPPPIRPTPCRAPAACARRWRNARWSSWPMPGPPTPPALAHIVLPAAGWAEKDGTVTNSERCISRQRAFRARARRSPPRLVDVRRSGAAAWAGAMRFPMPAPADIFREHAALSAFENDGARAVQSGRRLPTWTTAAMTHCRRCNGRCPSLAAAPRAPAPVRARRLFHARWPGAHDPAGACAPTKSSRNSR